MIDLHVHSNISDGTLKPEDLINYAFERGINTLAIADHETVIHFNEYRPHAEKLGMTLIPACEINVSDFKNFHFVVYGAKNIDFLEQYLQNIRLNNVEICRKVLTKLKDIFNIDLDEIQVAQQNHDGVLDKKAIAKILIKKGYAIGTKEVYDKYIGVNAPAYIPIQKITAPEAISLAHSCGGVIVWAHPFTTRKITEEKQNNGFSEREMHSLLKTLRGYGLDGIEVYTAKTTEEQSNILKEWAAEQNLFITGGSDFHSHYLANTIGVKQLTIQDLQALQQAIHARNLSWNKSDATRFLNQAKSEGFKKITVENCEDADLENSI